jgi:arylsulfatase A-like enzyme
MNLLVLCADTFRADYLGCYGNTWVQTPYLDKLGAEGVRFSDFYAEGLPTLPVRRVFYTGRRVFPFEYHPQKGDGVQLPGWHPLDGTDITLAEWIGERGYTTGLISDVYHMMKPGKNFHRGFQSWQWIRGQENDPLIPTRGTDVDLTRYVRPEVPKDAPLRRMLVQYLSNRAWWKSESDHYAAQVMRATADWIRNHGHKKPWMLWVESFDPHEPWDAPAEFVDRYCPDYDGLEPLCPSGFAGDYTEAQFARIKAHYAGECTHVDKWSGHVMDTLDSLGLSDDTVVVFTSDHGTMMGEQGEIHKGVDRLRIQVTRCPLIIRHPDRAYGGRVVEGFVQHQDLMPTLLHMLGEPVPESCDGESFWPAVTGEGRRAFPDVVISGFGAYASVRTKEWNYQSAWAKPHAGAMRPPELYDRRSDPDELVNVIDQQPDVARELQESLDRVLRDHPAAAGYVSETETPAAVPGVKW